MAVVRLSGPRAFAALASLAPAVKAKPRVAHRARLVDPADGTPVDDGLVLAFPGPASFTGEDVVELHVHGSPAVLARLFGVLSALGLRLAAPGEFTRRAFGAGKMDLAEAEGLADLISSDSDSQRLQALAQMGGAWAARIADWQSQLTDALAWLEAAIDFADEDDVPADVDGRAPALIAIVAREIASVLADGRRGEIVRDGLRVAIIGPPNVGKSTLLNALAGREAAIVSDMPGTTRDVVEVRLDLEGYVVVLSDTAGLRDSDDAIELEGMRRARDRAGAADLRIWVRDGTLAAGADRVGLETSEFLIPGDIVFWNKADLGVPGHFGCPAGLQALAGSARDGTGLDALVNVLRARLSGVRGEGALITRARHREALEAALAALGRAEAAAGDLAAEDVKMALRALARILGRFDVEQVLDRIFASFCIGK